MEDGVWRCRCHESRLSFRCPAAFSYRNLLLGTSTARHSMSATSVLCLFQDGSRGSCSRKKNYQWCLHGHFRGLLPGILLWRRIFQRTCVMDSIWIPLGSTLWCLAVSSCVFFHASVACWDALLSHIHALLVNWQKRQRCKWLPLPHNFHPSPIGKGIPLHIPRREELWLRIVRCWLRKICLIWWLQNLCHSYSTMEYWGYCK